MGGPDRKDGGPERRSRVSKQEVWGLSQGDGGPYRRIREFRSEGGDGPGRRDWEPQMMNGGPR